MIVVTGATGNIGRPLVQSLIAAGEDVTTVSRNETPSAAGAAHVQAALFEPASLKPAFKGADKLFLLLPGPQFDLPAIVDAAKDAGIGRIVYLSSQRVASRPEEGLGRIEEPVADSGLEWTMVRPGAFASNALQWAESIRAKRSIAAPFGDVGLPVIDPADIADVAAAALLQDAHVGKAYTLNGPVSMSPRQQAKVIGDVIGEELEFTEQTRDEAFATLNQFWAAEVVEGTLKALGEPNENERTPSGEVERVTGRPARTFADWVQRNLAAFQ